MAEILIVEDDEELNLLMAVILKKAGHKVDTCASGLEALRKLGIEPNSAPVEPPDLLVLDIMIPLADGYVVATLLRSTPRTRGIPILIVTALQELSRVFTATVQVDGFLSKPFAPEDLIGKVAEIIEKKKARA